MGECNIKKFCEAIVERKIFTSVESTRNVLIHIQKKGLSVKRGGYWKTIRLHPDMCIQTEGIILVDIKFSNAYNKPTDA